MKIRELQRQELEILLEFQRVCEKHGLRWYLTAGTLLGAVRHKGFIPWDDDVDVAMPRADYDRLAAACEADLSEQYFFQDYKSQPNFPYYFSKICKNGTRVYEPSLEDVDIHKGVYIDIFPLDVCPDGAGCATVLFKGVQLLDCAVLSQVGRRFVCGYSKWYMRAAYGVLRHLPRKWLFALREWLRKGMVFGASGEVLCTVGGRHGYPRETYRTSWFEPVRELPFEGCMFPAPSGWDELLRNMYGDYMTLPPVEEREQHFEEKED